MVATPVLVDNQGEEALGDGDPVNVLDVPAHKVVTPVIVGLGYTVIVSTAEVQPPLV